MKTSEILHWLNICNIRFFHLYLDLHPAFSPGIQGRMPNTPISSAERGGWAPNPPWLQANSKSALPNPSPAPSPLPTLGFEGEGGTGQSQVEPGSARQSPNTAAKEMACLLEEDFAEPKNGG